MQRVRAAKGLRLLRWRGEAVGDCGFVAIPDVVHDFGDDVGAVPALGFGQGEGQTQGAAGESAAAHDDDFGLEDDVALLFGVQFDVRAEQ